MTDPHLDHSLFGEQARPEETHHEPPDDRGHGHGRRGRRRWVALVIVLAVVVAAGFAAVHTLRPVVSQIVTGITAGNDYTGAGSGSVEVVIKPGDTGVAIAETLQHAGVVKTTKAFTEAASADPRAGSIQPGTYRLRKHMSAASAIGLLLDPSSRQVHRVTIREGLWKSEVFAALAKGTGHPVKAYERAAGDAKALRADGLPASAKGDVEGYLFPATYQFPPKSTPAQQIATMVGKAVSELRAAGVSPARMERTLTIASIVEAEARRQQDRPKVARVIENRLAKGMPLQMDSTVHFVAQQRGKAGTSDKQRAAKSPYNTYVHKGLPPGPIDSPGASSIAAAAHPAKGDWLYFVTTNPATGETRFAATLAEHNRNVKAFQSWCTRHKDQC